MTPKFVSFLILGLTLTMVPVQGQNVQAGSLFGDVGRGIDEGFDDYQQGLADGKKAGIADYPNRNSGCPPGHPGAYCLGWSSGYSTGFNAQKTIDESGGQSENDNNNDNDDN